MLQEVVDHAVLMVVVAHDGFVLVSDTALDLVCTRSRAPPCVPGMPQLVTRRTCSSIMVHPQCARSGADTSARCIVPTRAPDALRAVALEASLPWRFTHVHHPKRPKRCPHRRAHTATHPAAPLLVPSAVLQTMLDLLARARISAPRAPAAIDSTAPVGYLASGP